MIWLKLSLLALVASLCESQDSQDSHSLIVYALEKGVSLDFHLVDLNLTHTRKFTTFHKQKTDLASVYLSHDEYSLNLYWSFKDSSNIHRYQISSKKKDQIKLDKDDTVFLGVGYNGDIYAYSPKTKTVSLYYHESQLKREEHKGLQQSNTDMHCVDVDPRNREQLFFAECSGDKYTGRVYDFSEDVVLRDYKQDLPQCFDTWRITPNGRRAYAVKGKEVYMSPYEGAPFTKNYTAGDVIVGFAVGNNDFFYINRAKYRMSTISKVTPHGNEYRTKELKVEGKIKLMALYTPPRRYLVYSTENYDMLQFVYTDLNLKKSRVMLTVQTHGQKLDKMYLGFNENGDVFYWTYKNSSFLGMFGITSKENRMEHLNKNYGTLVGIGNKDKVYFYDRDTRTFTIYNVKSNIAESEIDIAPSETEMECVDVDPRFREQVFFAECTKKGNRGKVLDVKKGNILKDYDQELPVCFDTWRISPNAKRAYGVKSNTIYISQKEGAPFEVLTWTDEKIQEFAVGNNELFYTTEESGKIFKISPAFGKSGYQTHTFDVEGHVKALALYQE